MARKNRKDDRKRAYAVSSTSLRIAFTVVFLAILITAGRAAYSFGYSVFTTKAVAEEPGKDVAVTIEEGMSDGEIGSLLKEKGLIKNALVYRVQAKVYDFEVAPGTYVLNTSMDIQEMVEMMAPEEETEEDDSVIPTANASETETVEETETSGETSE